MVKFLIGIILLLFGIFSGGIGIAAMGGAFGIPGLLIIIVGGILVCWSIGDFFENIFGKKEK